MEYLIVSKSKALEDYIVLNCHSIIISSSLSSLSYYHHYHQFNNYIIQLLLLTPFRTAQQPIPLTKAVQIFRGIIKGLYYLHMRGIVHGDLKVSNVMLEHGWEPVNLDLDLGIISHHHHHNHHNHNHNHLSITTTTPSSSTTTADRWDTSLDCTLSSITESVSPICGMDYSPWTPNPEEGIDNNPIQSEKEGISYVMKKEKE